MEEVLNSMLIKFIREKFQTPSERKTLMSLMVKEINMKQMEETMDKVSFDESIKVFLSEVDEIVKEFEIIESEREKEIK